MGVALFDIPGVGPRSSWSFAAGSYAEYVHHVGIFNFRNSRWTRATARLNKRWVTYSASGSGSGGGGAGTQASPWLVRHMGDLKALRNAAMTGLVSCGILFPGDVVIPAERANTDQSLVNWADNISFGWDGTGTRKPELSGFCTPGVAPVALSATTARFNLPGGVRAWWVMSSATPSDRETYKLQPWTLCNNEAEAEATPFGFFCDVDGILTVNHQSHDPNTLLISVCTAEIINMGDRDFCAVHELKCWGGAMDFPGSAKIGGIRWENTGVNEGFEFGNQCLWSGYHASAHVVSAGSGAGGIVTFALCEWGYWQWNDLLSGDGHVSYNASGGHECIRWECFIECGGLPTLTVVPLGTTPYCHTANDATVFPAYVAEISCRYEIVRGVPFASNTMCASTPIPTNVTDQTQYRVYTFRRRVSACGGYSPAGNRGIHVAGTFPLALERPTGAFVEPFSAGSAGRMHGVWSSCGFTFQHVGNHGGKRTRVWNQSGGDSLFVMAHCRLDFTLAAGGTRPDGIDAQWGTNLGSCKLYNSVISNSIAGLTDRNFTTNPFANHLREADPDVAAGGLRNTAIFGMAATQFDACPGTITLAAAGQWTTPAGVPAACVNASAVLPSGIACDFDLFGARRRDSASQRSIGPIEANPMQAASGGGLHLGIGVGIGG